MTAGNNCHKIFPYVRDSFVAVDMQGVPQIPRRAVKFIAAGLEDEMPPEVQAECDAAIAAFIAEMRRRRIDVLANRSEAAVKNPLERQRKRGQRRPHGGRHVGPRKPGARVGTFGSGNDGRE